MGINPLILPPVLFAMTASAVGAPDLEVFRISAISALFYCFLPLGYLIFLKRRGKIDSIEARDRSKRAGVMMAGVLMLTLAVPALYAASDAARDITLIISLLLAINALILAIITRRFKISLHVSGVTGFFVIPLYLAWWHFMDELAVPMLFYTAAMVLIPVVAWARIKSDAHSGKEVAWGLAFGLLAPALEIWFVSLIA